MRRHRNIVATIVVVVCAAATSVVPSQATRAAGTLIVATTATYPPNEFTRPNGHAVVGMDPDLARALAALLGRRMKIVIARFDRILRGVASGEYDLGMSSITDTYARERLVDFVTYYSAGTSFYAKTNAGPKVTSLAQLCGRTVAVVSGTTQFRDAERQTASCRRAGKRDVTVAVFPDHLSAYIALESSNDAVGMADSPVASYIVNQSRGQLVLTGKPYAKAPYGIALPKGSRLTKPVLHALKKLMADGTYRAILKKWGIDSGRITNPEINGATS